MLDRSTESSLPNIDSPGVDPTKQKYFYFKQSPSGCEARTQYANPTITCPQVFFFPY